jgi:glutamate N-acetyltransferase/amino-acid N-acetyltransferase
MTTVNSGTITDVTGFRAAGLHCGLKKGDAPDLALILSDRPCTAAAVFTANQVKAAPVIYDQALLARNPDALRAVVINSGNANAVTGDRGLVDAHEMAAVAARAVGCSADQVWVMSTGVIGVPLNMERVGPGIEAAARELSPAGGHAAARAIMTTDTIPKEVALRVQTRSGHFTIAGIAKGAGMIHPNMATMLAIMATDASVPPDILDRALRHAVAASFNAISVDGDTSTNDTVVLLANGAAGVAIEDEDSEAYRQFARALTAAATTLAHAIVRDGEGATKFVEIRVRHALTHADAQRVAHAIARSSLVKTALHGEDANWGRVLVAAGYSGVDLDVDRLNLWFAAAGADETEPSTRRRLHLVQDGQPHDVDESAAHDILAGSDIEIILDLGLGDAEASIWTCDLSPEYVRINADYRT